MEASEHRRRATGELRAHLHGMWAARRAGLGRARRLRRRARRGRHGADARAGATAPGRARARARVRARRARAGGGAARRRRTARSSSPTSSPEMTAIAAARAAALGLDNVSTRVLDLEAIDEPDASYDVVLCREGLMFAPDPARAAREIRARAAARRPRRDRVWGPRERNPWLGVVFDARQRAARRAGAAARRPRPVLARRRRAARRRCSRGAGLADVAVERAADAAARRLVRRVVDADVRARRARSPAMLPPLPEPALRALERAAARGGARLRDGGRARAPGRRADRLGAAALHHGLKPGSRSTASSRPARIQGVLRLLGGRRRRRGVAQELLDRRDDRRRLVGRGARAVELKARPAVHSPGRPLWTV